MQVHVHCTSYKAIVSLGNTAGTTHIAHVIYLSYTWRVNALHVVYKSLLCIDRSCFVDFLSYLHVLCCTYFIYRLPMFVYCVLETAKQQQRVQFRRRTNQNDNRADFCLCLYWSEMYTMRWLFIRLHNCCSYNFALAVPKSNIDYRGIRWYIVDACIKHTSELDTRRWINIFERNTKKE